MNNTIIFGKRFVIVRGVGPRLYLKFLFRGNNVYNFCPGPNGIKKLMALCHLPGVQCCKNLTKSSEYQNIYFFITRNTGISFQKAHLQKSICFIFTCEKSLYSQSECYAAVFTSGRITNQQQRKGLCQPIKIVHRLHSNSFSHLAAFYRRLLQIILRRRRKALDFCQLVAAQTCLYGIKKTRTHRAHHREMSHCSKKNQFQGTC